MISSEYDDFTALLCIRELLLIPRLHVDELALRAHDECTTSTVSCSISDMFDAASIHRANCLNQLDKHTRSACQASFVV